MPEDVFYIRENAKGVKSAPKYEAFDMVMLYLDDKTYISSPYAQINKDEWEASPLGGTNGEFVFEFTEGSWAIDDTPVALSDYGITTYFAANTPQAKDGDKITVVRILDSTDSQNQEPNITIELTRSGKLLEANCPLVKPSARQDVADGLLARASGFRYQPFSASDAEVNPLADLGDAIYVHGIYSGMFEQTLNFNSLMTSDIGAPWEEETDNEFSYQTASERKYNRQFADIAAEFEITASNISAKVSKTGGATSSFGWTLLDDRWTLFSNNNEVFKADSSGIHVNGSGTFTGEIRATSGYIGDATSGFNISSDSIWNGVTSFDDTAHDGVYLGTAGLVLGKGKFKVDSEGNMTATSGTFKGTVSANKIQVGGDNGYISGSQIGSSTISGGNIGSGTITGGNIGSGTITGGNIGSYTVSGGNLVSGVNTSLGYADFSNLVFGNNNTYASYVKGSVIKASAAISAPDGGYQMGSYWFYRRTANVTLSDGTTKSIHYVAWQDAG